MRDTTNSVKYEAFVKSRLYTIPYIIGPFSGSNLIKLDSKANLRYL